MTRILITGMSCTGKTSVLNELSRRGHDCVETDDPAWIVPEDGDSSRHDKEWIWNEGQISVLLEGHADDHLIVSGCRPNQGRFYNRFDHIVVFQAPITVMLERAANRTNNPFGKNAADREAIRTDKDIFEPMLVNSANLVIDTSEISIEEVADRVEALL